MCSHQSKIHSLAGALLDLLVHRDNEDAHVSVNGKTCWTKAKAVGTDGEQICGGFFKEEKFRVTGCYITLSASDTGVNPLTVRVWTNLDGEANDESFGIDNFIIAKLQGEGE